MIPMFRLLTGRKTIKKNDGGQPDHRECPLGVDLHGYFYHSVCSIQINVKKQLRPCGESCISCIFNRSIETNER